MNPWSASLLVVCGWCAEIAAVRAQHAGDILVGRTTDLALSATGVPAQTLFLPPVASGPFLGWSSTVLGFDAVVSTNANGSLGPLTSGANVHLEAVSIDPGLSLRSFTTPGFSVNTAWGSTTPESSSASSGPASSTSRADSSTTPRVAPTSSGTIPAQSRPRFTESTAAATSWASSSPT